ncbi:MAG: exo-alpha-sialidase [Clostridia bacterium]|nr:exo-alpha-sialidase [Clostridia bacterium]
MKTDVLNRELPYSVQINDGLRQTCSDGASLAFDAKYGIMFCAHMPGYHGDYGESRGKIALSYFPASQPTNIRFIDVAVGDNVYVPNILSLGDGCVRMFYERHSRAEGDHPVCYKDFDFKTETLGEECTVQVKTEGGALCPLGLSCCFAYLEKNGYFNHVYKCTEQIIVGGCTYFEGEDGLFYGAISGELSEVILFRSEDHMETIEFFAVYPKQVQYEFDYKIIGSTIYAIYRTNHEKDATSISVSADFGKTWSEPVDLENSIQCRPRAILSGGKILMAYNDCNQETGSRPNVIMGRTSVKFCTIENGEIKHLAGYHSKYGIVNIALADVLGDVYMAYSTSELALEYQNGTPWVRGKDATRYVKLGDLFSETK